MKIELIYDPDCPNVDAARSVLSQAIADSGVEEQWLEVNRSDPSVPSYAQGFGSPTVLVNGVDVAGTEEMGGANSCRVYATADGAFQSAPPVELVVAALRQNVVSEVEKKGAAKGLLSVMPVLGAVLLPGVSCPACWPAYVALLGSIGIGFVDYSPYLFPLTFLMLTVAFLAMSFTARSQCFYWPLVLAFVGSSLVLFGRFYLESSAVLWAGVVLLIFVGFWQLFHKRKRSFSGECCNCSGDELVGLKTKHGDSI